MVIGCLCLEFWVVRNTSPIECVSCISLNYFVSNKKIKMKKTLIIIFTFLTGFNSFSHEKPKLVVGIVVDQCLRLYLSFLGRFWRGWFQKLINEGHFFRNCQFGYVPTYTGPGHVSIFTGTTPQFMELLLTTGMIKILVNIYTVLVIIK